MTDWRKSSHSKSGNCVEVAGLPGAALVRDTKDRDGAVLAFKAAVWAAFLGGARLGEFGELSQPLS